MSDSVRRFTGPGKRKKPFDIAGFVLRRSSLILVLSLILFAMLMPIVPVIMPKSTPSYMASGKLLIDPGKETTLTGRERETIPGTLGDFTRTLVNRVGGRAVIQNALRNLPEDEWPVFLRKNSDELGNIIRIQKRLKTAEIQRTHLIDVFLKSDSPHGIAELLNNIMQSLIDQLHREQEQRNARQMGYLTAERDKISARIDMEQQQLLALAGKVDNKAFLHEGYNAHLSRLEQIQRLYWEAYTQEVNKEGELNKALKDREGLEAMSLQPFADERVADNFGINRIEQWTYEQNQSLRTTIDGLTTNNADRQYVEDRMDAMNRYLEQYKKDVNVATIDNLVQKRRYELDEQVLLARHAYDAAKAGVERLQTELEQAVIDASDVSYTIFRAADSTYAISQLRERLGALNARIDDCEMEAKAPVRVSIERLADTPTLPVSPSSPKWVLIAFVLSFGAVMAVFVGFDFLDNRIRSDRELRAALGSDTPQPIPRCTAPMETASLTPNHPAQAALRILAMRMNYEHETYKSKRFLLTGLEAQCGTTTLAINLAHLLSAYAERVALIQVAHPNTKEAGASGEVLASPHPDHQRNCDCIHVTYPLDTLPRKALADALDRVQDEYDIIIIDAPPYLHQDITPFIAQHCDAVLLVAREDQSLYLDMTTVCIQLAAARTPALSAVLNWSRHHTSDWYVHRFHRMLSLFSRIHARVEQKMTTTWTRWRTAPKNPSQ